MLFGWRPAIFAHPQQIEIGEASWKDLALAPNSIKWYILSYEVDDMLSNSRTG
jgi:hypothetical protein